MDKSKKEKIKAAGIQKLKKYHKLNVRIGLFFLGLVIVVAAVTGTLIYHINYSDALDFTSKRLIRCGNYADNVINVDMVDNWLKNGSDYDYETTMIELRAIQKTFELSYVNVFRPCYDEDGNLINEVECIFNLNPEGDKKDTQYKLGDHLTGLKEFTLIEKALETGEPQTTEMFDNTYDGKLLTVLVPLKLQNGVDYAVISVNCRMENVHRFATHTSVAMVISVEVIIALFAAILLLYINKYIARPVKQLSKRMDQFVANGGEVSDSDFTVVHTYDEIEQMADNFNSMAASIKQYTDDLKQVTASQERLRAELDVAGSIRSAVSAETAYPAYTERSDFELCASLKNTVYNSCSFCNYFLIDEDHLVIVLGESVGKSLPSMLMSMLASTNICALAKMHVEPYKIAYETNNSLCGFERNDMSMTVSALIAKIDLSSGEMTYVNAGMPTVAIKRTGEPYTAEPESMQFNLGEMHGVSFDQKSLNLNQGETLFFTSYGVSENENADGEKLTRDRMLEAINDIAQQIYPLNEMIDEIENRLDRFRGDTPVKLDTTILGFRYLG